MIKKISRLLKKLSLIALIITLFTFNACKIEYTQAPDSGVDLSNGVITQGIIEANFTIALTSYNVSLSGRVVNESLSQGSGVVFEKTAAQEGEYKYALLTNNHVIYKDTSLYTRFDCSVRDYMGNAYRAEVAAFDPNYDLAVVTFTADKDYKVLSFATQNPKISDDVVSIGQPLGIINAVTEGKVEKYTTLTIATDNGQVNNSISNVTFEVVRHSAPINSGSSGGALLDKDYKICGINYAAAVVQGSQEFVSGYAVPVDKVKQFLTEKYYLT